MAWFHFLIVICAMTALTNMWWRISNQVDSSKPTFVRYEVFSFSVKTCNVAGCETRSYRSLMVSTRAVKIYKREKCKRGTRNDGGSLL